MEDERLEKFPILDLTLPELPLRSRLYHLEPIGLGTPYVESLISYVARLAQAHSVTVRDLIKLEILPLLDKPKVSEMGKAFWSRAILSINGTNIWADKWVQALEKLTLRTELRFLTMLTWREVLPSRGLLRRHLAWCPECYSEWRQEELVIYNPLLWALEVVTMCPRHNRPLVFHCPSCKQTLPALTSKARLGYCSNCECWLGVYLEDKEVDNSNPIEDELRAWIAKVVGELLAVAPNLTVQPEKKRLTNNLSNLITQVSGKAAAFATKLQKMGTQFNFAMIGSWLRQKHLPKLSSLLEIGYHFNLTPLDFFTQEVLINEIYLNSTDLENIPDRFQQPRNTFDVDKARFALRTALMSTEVPPVSFNAVIQCLKSTDKTLKKYFPQECQELIKRYTLYWDNRLKQLETDLIEVSESNEDPPPSMAEVARRMGVDHSYLLNRFSEICRKISKKYQAYKQARSSEKKQALCEEVRQATLRLHAQNEYPSRNKVAATIGKSEAVIRDKEVKAAWQDTLHELGLKP